MLPGAGHAPRAEDGTSPTAAFQKAQQDLSRLPPTGSVSDSVSRTTSFKSVLSQDGGTFDAGHGVDCEEDDADCSVPVAGEVVVHAPSQRGSDDSVYLESEDMLWAVPSPFPPRAVVAAPPRRRRMARRCRGFAYLCVGAFFLVLVVHEVSLPWLDDYGDGTESGKEGIEQWLRSCIQHAVVQEPSPPRRWHWLSQPFARVWRRVWRKHRRRRLPVPGSTRRPSQLWLRRLGVLAVGSTAVALSTEPPAGQLASSIAIGGLLAGRTGAIWAGLFGGVACGIGGTLLGGLSALVVCNILAPMSHIGCSRVGTACGGRLGKACGDKLGGACGWMGFMFVVMLPAMGLIALLLRLC